MSDVKSTMNRVVSGERNPHKWCLIGDRPVRWSDKAYIQSCIDLMVHRIKQLSEENEVLGNRIATLAEKMVNEPADTK